MPDLTKRNLLTGAAIGSAGFAAGLLLAPTKPRQEEISQLTNSALPDGVFGHDTNLAPMNAANLSPVLRPVEQRISEYSRQLGADVSFIARQNFVNDKIEASRVKVADMIGVSDPQDIAFVRNTSEANSIINSGFPLSEDEEVLCWDQNHPTNRRSWQYRQQQSGFLYREISLPSSITSGEQIIDRFVSALSPKTKVVTFTELSNISGLRLPAQDLCSAIHKFNPDIFIHIDGAQSWGALSVNLEATGCDSFSSSAHKWFMGPRGTGILYVSKKWARRIMPPTLGYDFLLNYPEEELPDTAKRFECLGQRDIAPYAAIADTVDVHTALGGSQQIETEIAALTHYTIERLGAAGIKAVTPAIPEFWHGVVTIDLDSSINVYGAFLALHNEGIAAAFVDGPRVCCAPDGEPVSAASPTYLRLSTHIYNSRDDIDRAIAVINRVKSSPFEIIGEVVRFL